MVVGCETGEATGTTAGVLSEEGIFEWAGELAEPAGSVKTTFVVVAIGAASFSSILLDDFTT